MTKRRSGPRSAYQRGEDIGDAIGEVAGFIVQSIVGLVKWIGQKVKSLLRK